MLDFAHRLAKPLAGEAEAVALRGHVFGQALEFLGGFQAGVLAGFDREHFLDEGVGGGDEQVTVGRSDGGTELDGQRQRQRPGAHLQPGFVGLDDLLPGVLPEGLVDAVEDGIVFDFRHQQQGGLGDLERVAFAGHGNGDHLGVIERDREAEFAAERGEDAVPLEAGGLFEAVRQTG